jgi:hypothetical protein
MSVLSPETEREGLRAYEQARAFENLRRRKFPVIYGGFALLFLLGGLAMLKTGHVIVADINFAVGLLLPFLFRKSWRRLTRRYEANLRLLAQLEREHGDALSWVQMEKHFAALDRLRAELAEEERNRPR